ncbi:MAG: glutamate racemase [Acidobacteriota bacterium]
MSWGVFDSGVGGLTVVRALRRRLPGVRLAYLGDTARVPYGIRSVDTVRRYAAEAAAFFRRRDVEGLIVACNTVSAVALDVVEQGFPGPVLDVVRPGVAAALAATRSGRVGVIGTPATIRSDAYGAGLRAARPDAVVVSRACPLFVPLAEEGWVDGEVPRLVARRYLAPLIEAGVDTVVLGCTHYPLLRDVIGETLGPDVRLVDSAEAVADVARGRTTAPATSGGGTEHEHCFVTDAGGAFREVAERFLGAPIGRLEQVELGA